MDAYSIKQHLADNFGLTYDHARDIMTWAVQHGSAHVNGYTLVWSAQHDYRFIEPVAGF